VKIGGNAHHVAVFPENGRLANDLEKPGDLPWADAAAGGAGAETQTQPQTVARLMCAAGSVRDCCGLDSALLWN
jgi:hypothetical protein